MPKKTTLPSIKHSYPFQKSQNKKHNLYPSNSITDKSKVQSQSMARVQSSPSILKVVSMFTGNLPTGPCDRSLFWAGEKKLQILFRSCLLFWQYNQLQLRILFCVRFLSTIQAVKHIISLLFFLFFLCRKNEH